MSEFSLLYPEWLLALLPVALLIAWLMHRTHSSSLISPHLAKAMGVEKHDSSKLLLSLALVWTLVIIALSGPSFGKQNLPTMSNNHARVLVMDMSRSMYANDNKPDRLTQARYKASDLLKQWQEGYTGLVAYAGDAYTVSPMTSDSATINALLPSLSPDIMPYPGADAARGVKKAIELLHNAGFASGSIILITDDLDKGEAKRIASLLDGSHWKLAILGMGTRVGAPIPLKDGSLLQNNNGQTVIAKADFDQMSQLAGDVSGLFISLQADNRDINAIAAAEKSALISVSQGQQQVISDQINHGYWLLPLVVIAALGLFRRGFIFALAVLVLSGVQPNTALATPWLNDDQQAKKLYDEENYTDAAKQFNDAEWRGSAQYQAGDFKAAIDSFSSIATPNNRQKYNLANAYAKNGDLQQAKDLYQQVLQQQPDNQDARHNLQQVEQALKRQQQQQDSKNNQGDKSQQKPSQNNSDQQAQQDNQQHQNAQSGQQDKVQPDGGNAQKQPESNTGQKKNEQRSQQQDAAEQKSSQQTQAQQSMSQADSKEQPPVADTTNSQTADPELRKLEQVENARDPSRLLRAQLLLQAKQQEPPKDTGKSW